MSTIHRDAHVFKGSVTFEGAVIGSPIYVTVDLADLRGAQAQVYGFASPVAGTITNTQTRLKAALATGDAIVTGKIGATGITTGVITIAEASSGAGDIDSAAPTAANVVAVGSNVNFTISGTNTATVGATLTVTIVPTA